MPTDPRPIGVFDSGIGGLTVLKHLARRLPHERFVYLGDTARVPYGNRSDETVRLYAKQCADFLLKHDVKLIVVACNTVSAVAMEHLRSFVSVPVIGVIEPAAAEAVAATTNHHIGVIGTRATIGSDAYGKAIGRCSESESVHSRACPLFVPLVEEGWLDTAATRAIAEEYLRPLQAQQIDTLVLGCTHYPLLAPILHDLLPHVTLIDCGACTAAEAVRVLGAEGGSDTEIPVMDLYVTDVTPSFASLARQFLGMPVNDPVVVSLESLTSRTETS